MGRVLNVGLHGGTENTMKIYSFEEHEGRVSDHGYLRTW